MHMFLKQFDELNTRRYKEGIKEDDLDDYPLTDYIVNPKDGKYQIKNKYYTNEKFDIQPVVLVDYDTAKMIESKAYTEHPILSVYFISTNTKYKYKDENDEIIRFQGVVFNDEPMVRARLDVLKSKEVKYEEGE